MVDIHSPPNTKMMDEIYMFVSVDGGGEGIIAAPLAGQMMTLVTLERHLVDKMVPMARMLANRSGKKIKVLKFTVREEIMEIEP